MDLQLKTKISAQEYKDGLPVNWRGTVWTMETFSVCVNLLYPHITVVSGQRWSGARKKYQFNCVIHGQYEANADNILRETKGCQCKGCTSDKKAASAGTMSKSRGTKEEKELAAKLRKEGLSYREIGRQLGRDGSTIQNWLDLDCKERKNRCDAKWQSENKARNAVVKRRYRTEFAHGKAVDTKSSQKRRSLKYHASDVVFLPDHPEADSQGFVSYDCYDLITTDEDRILWSFPGADEDVAKRSKQQKGLAKISGEKYSLEHLIPLSKGGLHHPMNFVNRSLKLNIQKGNKMLKEDMELFCKRLFS